VGRLGLGSGPHIVGRLGSGMRVSASFQIIPRPLGRLGLGLGSRPHVVCRLGSGPRVMGRLGSRVWVSSIFEIFECPRLGTVRVGNCPTLVMI